MKGFTVVCNSCGNKVDFDQKENKRHDLDNKFSVMIHSNVECAFKCWACEEQTLLNDKQY